MATAMHAERGTVSLYDTADPRKLKLYIRYMPQGRAMPYLIRIHMKLCGALRKGMNCLQINCIYQQSLETRCPV
jgi:hypothetical protein